MSRGPEGSDLEADGGSEVESSDRLRVCDAEELPAGDHALVDVDGVQVGVFNVDGEYYAIQNECAHQGGPVCAGDVRPELRAEFEAPGERVRESHGDRPVIACPWHGWEYDLETGSHLGVQDIAVRTYPVVEDDGVVYVEKSASSPDSQ
jgi:nitrite reductase/ring-hydroxylating ferredoxin subunit